MVKIRRTVVVKNLPPTSTIEDVKSHFEAYLGNCEPVVNPLVPYQQLTEKGKEDRRSTTVTFRGESSWKDRIEGNHFYPKVSEDETQVMLTYHEEFIGLSPIAQDIGVTDPDFEFVFIHGLGGHAFNTWTYESGSSTKDLTMWPRDLISRELHDRKLDGRYWTFGYGADTKTTKDGNPHVIKTINEASEELLLALKQEGFGDHSRPIYFAAHSLGGLVLCDALNDALRPLNGNSSNLSKKPHYQEVLMRGTECKVKGVVFFGTPFRGSVVANRVLIFKELGKYFKLYNVELVRALRLHSKELADIATCFNQVEAKFRIKPIIYYENRRFMNWRKVVGAKSAQGALTSTARPLDANHMQMIKFSSAQDHNFGIVLNDIHELLQMTQEAREAAPAQIPRLALTPSQQALEEKSPVVDATEVQLQAMEDFANHLLSIVARQKNSNVALPIPNKFTESKWGRRKHSVSSAEHSTIPPGTPQSSSHGIKRPKITLNDIQTIDEDAAKAANPPPPYKQADSIAPLRKFDIVFILDDSESMSRPVVEGEDNSTTLWEVLVEALRYFGDVAAQSDDDGVDIRFLVNDDKNVDNLRRGQQILDILAKIEIQPSRSDKLSSLDSVLWGVLKGYVDTYHQYKVIEGMKFPGFRLHVQPPKPLILVVVTSGLSHDYEKVEAALTRAARAFSDLEMDEFQVGVQFIQVGSDDYAKKRLLLLDDKLAARYGVRDICDTKFFDKKDFEDANPEDLVDKLRKVLLSSVTEEFQGFEKKELKPYWGVKV